MNILKPSIPLSPYIKSYIIVESDNELLNRVLPDTSVIIAIRYKGTVEYLHIIIGDLHGRDTWREINIKNMIKSFSLATT